MKAILDTLCDLWGFLTQNKKWWLLPLAVTLVLLGLLIALASSSGLTPFLYGGP